VIQVLQFQVSGDPAPEPRHRTNTRARRPRTYQDDSADDWKTAVRLAARNAALRAGLPLPAFGPGQPLLVSLGFTFARPLGHFVARDRARPLRATAPTWMANRPDGDNLEKAVLDACGAWQPSRRSRRRNAPPLRPEPILWEDDCVVVAVHRVKRYGDRPGLVMAVSILEGLA
jgi:Holliday junction resolvase RusA-like endonuclease